MNIISTASGTTAAKPGYFSSFKIRTRISAGFAVVLVLLAGLGIASTLGIRGLSQNFDAYANVSDETVAGALIDGDVNDIRDNVRLFANTGEKSIAEDVNKHYDKIMKSIADMLAVTRSPQRLKMFQEIEENLRSYFKNFTTLVELRTQYGSTTTRMNDTAARASKAIKAADAAADETKSVETANQTMEMVEDFLEARVSALRFVATPKEEYANEFDAALKKLNGPHDAVQKSGFKKLMEVENAAMAAVGDYGKATKEMMRLAGEIDKLTGGPMKKSTDLIEEIGTKLLASQGDARARQLAESHATDQRTQMIVIGASAGGLMLGIALAWLIGRMIANPLINLVRPIEELASGNFNVTVPATGRQDEIGQIAEAVAQMAAKISATIAEIKASGREVTNASAEISTSTTDLSQRTEEQAASLEQTSAAMEELSATVKKNSESAQLANIDANNTRDVADRGGKVVAKAVEAMSKIEDSSRKISDIIGVIDEIARQTNLLALNAAVEAARAGEAGRGFAVVASEVRSLAQRSSQAAKDIKDLITNSNGQVKDGVALVNKAGESLSEILESIKKVASGVSDIANASIEQATGIDEINKALAQMDEVTQQNSALVEENAATAKTLEHQAKAMDEQVAFFRVGHIDETQDTSCAAVAAKPVARPAGKAKPATKAAARAVSAGPARQMQTALATAVGQDWKEF